MLHSLSSHTGYYCGQVVSVPVSELEAARVASLVSVGAELAQTNKHALLAKQDLAPDTRATLLMASRFTAMDYLQVRACQAAVAAAFTAVGSPASCEET